ncbi:hypothetical protein GCM10009869_03920 [Amnibacterium kyonggiense]
MWATPSFACSTRRASDAVAAQSMGSMPGTMSEPAADRTFEQPIGAPTAQNAAGEDRSAGSAARIRTGSRHAVRSAPDIGVSPNTS